MAELIELQGYQDLLNHTKANYLIHVPLRHFMQGSANALRQALFRVSPRGRTKAFMRGWVVTVGSGDPPTTVVAKNTDPKAAMVMLGTRSHIIRPLSKKALFWAGGPGPRRLVHHPGTRANDVPAKGLAEAAGEFAQLRSAFDAEVTRRFDAKGGA